MSKAKKKVVTASKSLATPEKTTQKAALPKVVKGVKYEATGKYNPKAAHNIKSYEEIVAVLPATVEEMALTIPKHIDFIGYLIRREGLEVASK